MKPAPWFTCAFAALALTCPSLPAHAEGKTVQVAYLPLMAIAPLFVMEQEGWAKEAGIDLALTKFSSGPAIIQALGSGKFDAVYMSVSPVLVAKSAGIDLKIIAASGFESHAFVATGKLSEVFTGAATPKAAFEAFAKANGRPAKIGSLPKGSMPDTLLRYYIEQNGLSSSEVQILSQGEEAVRQAVLAGAADGALMPEPIITIIEQKVPSAKVVADGHKLMAGHPGFVLAVRSGFARENPEIVAKLAGLNDRAVSFIQVDPGKSTDDIFAFFGKGLIEKDVMAAALTSPYNPPLKNLADIVSGAQILQDYQVKIGVQAKPVDLGELFDTRLPTKKAEN